jgi:hypothetical protein
MPGPVTDIRAAALRRRYRQLFGGADVPVPVDAIAEDLCSLQVAQEPGLAVSGMLVPAERRIRINADEPHARRRFTLAHELGHWICQCLEGRPAPLYCRATDVGLDPSTKTIEREANVFAAELLMPEEHVRMQWAASPSVDVAARAFDVSDEAMRWRLYSFGLLPEPPR